MSEAFVKILMSVGFQIAMMVMRQPMPMGNPVRKPQRKSKDILVFLLFNRFVSSSV